MQSSIDGQVESLVREMANSPSSATLVAKGEQKFALQEVLQDKALFGYLKRFCTINYDEECVLCYEHIERLKLLQHSNTAEFDECLQRFVDQFVTGDMEINISGALRARLVALRRAPDPLLLDQALPDVLSEVLRMMQNSFVGFSKVLTRATREAVRLRDEALSSPNAGQLKKVKQDSVPDINKTPPLSPARRAVSLRVGPLGFARKPRQPIATRTTTKAPPLLSCGTCGTQNATVNTCCKRCKAWSCSSCLVKGTCKTCQQISKTSKNEQN